MSGVGSGSVSVAPAPAATALSASTSGSTSGVPGVTIAHRPEFRRDAMAAAGGLPHPLRMRPWRSSFPAEVHEHPAEVVRILLDPVVEGLHILAVQEAQDSLLELARALPGDDLDERCLLRDGLGHDRGERVFDLVPAVVDVVQVELEL